MDDAQYADLIVNVAELRRRIDAGQVLEEAQDMFRGQLEREYAAVVAKYTILAEQFVRLFTAQ